MKTTSKATTATTSKATTAKKETAKGTRKTAPKASVNATATTDAPPVKEATAPKASAPKTTPAPVKAEPAKAEKPVVTLETAMANPIAVDAVADAILKVDPRNVNVRPGFNVRNELGDLTEMKKSIEKSGLLLPIVAVKIPNGTWEVVDGHRRFEAVTQLIKEGVKIDTVDVREFTGTEAQRILFMLTTGTTQKNLNEMEQADALARLEKEGLKVEEIMSALGVSKAHVYNLKEFLKFSPELKKLIYANQITATTVLVIARREKNPKVQLAVAQGAIKKAESDAKRFNKDVKPATKKDLAVKAEPLETILNRVFIDAEALDGKGKPKKGYVLLQALLDGERSDKAIAALFNF